MYTRNSYSYMYIQKFKYSYISGLDVTTYETHTLISTSYMLPIAMTI